MRFELKTRPQKPVNRNYEIIKRNIPKSIRDNILEYQPTEDSRQVEFIVFKRNLTLNEKTIILSMFTELKEV